MASENQQTGTGRTSGAGGRLSGQMYQTVKKRLLDGDIPAGARLSVEALRSEFGVSKQPVMEALRLLAGDGLIEILPQIGSVVLSYPQHEVHDFFKMFAGFEGAIAAVAATRATPAGIRDLDAISQRIKDLGAHPDEQVRSYGYRELNREFHEQIHNMAGSRIISTTSRRMWDLSDFLINTHGLPRPLANHIPERQEDHDKIRDALAAGDAETAKAQMEAHILDTTSLFEEPVSAA
ncbi:GntR family transcriptional regulator [Pseudarthrobacter sp. NPDC058119]|uniref:GntR family transcriptional regulator n=1 Tax=Pseudarthrobacter sp. NPDC058119 TaxID=3346348 RepID=UPI0036D7719C